MAPVPESRRFGTWNDSFLTRLRSEIDPTSTIPRSFFEIPPRSKIITPALNTNRRAPTCRWTPTSMVINCTEYFGATNDGVMYPVPLCAAEIVICGPENDGIVEKLPLNVSASMRTVKAWLTKLRVTAVTYFVKYHAQGLLCTTACTLASPTWMDIIMAQWLHLYMYACSSYIVYTSIYHIPSGGWIMPASPRIKSAEGVVGPDQRGKHHTSPISYHHLCVTMFENTSTAFQEWTIPLSPWANHYRIPRRRPYPGQDVI